MLLECLHSDGLHGQQTLREFENASGDYFVRKTRLNEATRFPCHWVRSFKTDVLVTEYEYRNWTELACVCDDIMRLWAV